VCSKTGWATKQGGQIKTWRKRWFVLKDQHLHYYKVPSVRHASLSQFETMLGGKLFSN
jgi:hypothetical protein